MTLDQSNLKALETSKTKNCCNVGYLAGGVIAGAVIAVSLMVSYFAGRQSIDQQWNGLSMDRVHPEVLAASATHGGSNLAVCTAQVDENAEGFFALDFLTGDLKAWVYYPRAGAFGGFFRTNVQAQFGMGAKNPEYLLVSGNAAAIRAGGNMATSQSLIYVVDVRSGMFAAYQVPWDKTRESSRAEQMGEIFFVGGGQIREATAGAPKKPVAPPPGGKKPGAPNNPADPDADGVPPANVPPGGNLNNKNQGRK